MTNIQLVHFRQCGNRQHVVVSQAVTRVDLKPLARCVSGRFGNACQLRVTRWPLLSFGIGAGVNFNIGAPAATAASI